MSKYAGRQIRFQSHLDSMASVSLVSALLHHANGPVISARYSCYWALPHFPHRARRSFSRTCFCRVSSRRDVTERQEVAERIGLAAERAFPCAQPEADNVCFLHSVKRVELSPVSIKREQHNWATEGWKRYIRNCCRLAADADGYTGLVSEISVWSELPLSIQYLFFIHPCFSFRLGVKIPWKLLCFRGNWISMIWSVQS